MFTERTFYPLPLDLLYRNNMFVFTHICDRSILHGDNPIRHRRDRLVVCDDNDGNALFAAGILQLIVYIVATYLHLQRLAQRSPLELVRKG